MTAAVGAHEPYFFLSHAHPLDQDLTGTDPDHWVKAFCDDLSSAVAHRSAGIGGRIGEYRRCRDEPETRDANAVDALRGAGLFLALYSEPYVRDSAARRERLVFADARRDARQRIVPVLWEKPLGVGSAAMAVAEEAALTVVPDVPDYREFGLSDLCRHPARLAGAYRSTLDALSAWIVAVAQGRPLDRQPPAHWQPLHPVPTERFVVNLLAPSFPEPLGESSWYGRSATDWRPFQPADERPIGARVAALVNPDFYRTELVDGARAALPTQDCPGVLLIDPFISRDSAGEQLLRAVLDSVRPWIVPALVACGESWARNNGHQNALARTRATVGRPEYSRPWQRGPAVLKRAEQFDDFFQAVIRDALLRYDNRPAPPRPDVEYGPRPRINDPLPFNTKTEAVE
jgi:FxsC-like protein